MKKIISLVLSISIIISIFNFTIITSYAATSGTCGDNLTWTLDDSGLLTISGTGPMYNYSYSESPWCNRSIKSINITEGVISVGNYAFYHCYYLTSITIPNSVTSIGNLAFKFCTTLTSIEIPNSVTSIGDEVFSQCSSITNITIPSSVTTIGKKAFSSHPLGGGPSHLTEINVDPGNKYYTSCDGVLFDKDKKTLIAFPGGKSGHYNIPEGVSIEEDAFCGCWKLTSITIPNCWTSIGQDAFGYCESLTSIEIPSSVTSIGQDAFGWCESLTSIEIPNSVTSIEDYTFAGCYSLTSIEIPSSVTSIGNDAFVFCTSLTSITIPNSVTSIGDSAFSCCDSLKDVYYLGTSSAWNKISIGSKNEPLLNATISFNGTRKVTVDTLTNGIVTPNLYEAEEGEEVTLSICPDSGYRIKSVKYNGIEITPVNNTYKFTMPSENVLISAEFEKIKYAVNIDNTKTNGTVSAISTEFAWGETVTLTVTPDTGYRVKAIKKNGTALTPVQGVYGFEMPKQAVSISAEFEKITYAVNIDNSITNGIVSAISYDFAWGETVTLTVTPDSGYRVKFVKKDGVALTPVQGVYSFEMPKKDVSITAEFIPLSITKPTASGIVYGQLLSDSILSNGKVILVDEEVSGVFEWKNPQKALSVGMYTEKVVFTPNDASILESFEIDVDVNVSKNQIKVDFPEFNKTDFIIGTKLSQIEIENTNEYGTFSWQNNSQKIVSGENVCKMIFTPKDTKNYEYDCTSKNYIFTNTILPNTIYIADGEGVQAGENTTRNVNITSNTNVSAIIFDVIYPLDIDLTSITKSNFSIVDLSEKRVKDGKNVATIVCQYSETGASDDNVNIVPLKLNFSALTTAKAEVKEIKLANCTFYDKDYTEIAVTELGKTTINVTPKLVDSITISGASSITNYGKYTATAYPEYATNKNIAWSVSDTSVATINDSGELTALKNGSVTIKASATDGSGVYATKSVTVYATAKIDSMKSDIGYWSRSFNPQINNYTIFVDESATSIGITSVFTNGTLKLNGTTLVINKTKKSIALNDNVTTVTFNRAVSGTSNGVYKITIIKGEADCFSVEKTETENNIIIDISVADIINFDSGNLVLAAYDSSNAMLFVDSSNVTGSDRSKSFKFAKDLNVAYFKVMLLDDIHSIVPIAISKTIY